MASPYRLEGAGGVGHIAIQLSRAYGAEVFAVDSAAKKGLLTQLGATPTRAATCSGVFTLLPMLTGEGREHHGEILREATKLAEAGKIIPRLDRRRFTLETVGDAYRAITAGPVAGKIVVDVDPLARAGE